MTYKNETVGEWLDEWLDVYVKPPVRTQNTYDCYRYVIIMMKKIQPELFQMQLKDVDEMTIQKLLNQSTERYAKSTLKKMKIVFKSSYEIAIRNHKCEFNPATYISVPEGSEKEIRALTIKEEEAVIRAARNDCLGHIVIFLLNTGLRACELMNLKWSDYDPINRVIYVRKSKSKAGIRKVPLLYEANKIIQSQPHYCDYIFTSTKHTQATKTVMRKLYERIRKQTGIDIVTNHVYRHSFATRLVENSADYKAVSKLLGHANVAFTIHKYVDADDDFIRRQISVLETHHEKNVIKVKHFHVAHLK